MAQMRADEATENYYDYGVEYEKQPEVHYEEEVKMTKRPGADDSEAKEVLYKKHRKAKVESTCPSWLRSVVK